MSYLIFSFLKISPQILKKIIILVSIIIIFQASHAQICFDSFLSEGVDLYRKHLYQQAKLQFDAANICEDKRIDTLNHWIDLNEKAITFVKLKNIIQKEKTYLYLFEQGNFFSNNKDYTSAKREYLNAKEIADSLQPYFNNQYDSIINIHLEFCNKILDSLNKENIRFNIQILMNKGDVSLSLNNYLDAYNYYQKADSVNTFFSDSSFRDSIKIKINKLLLNVKKSADKSGFNRLAYQRQLAEISFLSNNEKIANKYVRKLTKRYPNYNFNNSSEKFNHLWKLYNYKFNNPKWELNVINQSKMPFFLAPQNRISFIEKLITDQRNNQYYTYIASNISNNIQIYDHNPISISFRNSSYFNNLLPTLGLNYYINKSFVISTDFGVAKYDIDYEVNMLFENLEQKDTIKYYSSNYSTRSYYFFNPNIVAKYRFYILKHRLSFLPYTGLGLQLISSNKTTYSTVDDIIYKYNYSKSEIALDSVTVPSIKNNVKLIGGFSATLGIYGRNYLILDTRLTYPLFYELGTIPKEFGLPEFNFKILRWTVGVGYIYQIK